MTNRLALLKTIERSHSTCAAERCFRILAAGLFACLLLLNIRARAENRILQPIDSQAMTILPGSVHPLAQARYDAGALASDTNISGVSLYFKPSPAQQADLEALLARQQTPSSPDYHKWLTPAQFADRFGMTPDDLGKVEAWLQSRGLRIDSVSLSRNRISFSGNAGQIAALFQTELHRYRIDGQLHIANSTPLSIPAALSGVVAGVRNLVEFRPRPKHHFRPSSRYTGGDGSHYLTPDDFTTIYDVKAQYNAGYTGSGQTIVVVGQSAIEASDIANFRSAAGLTANAPTFTLVPNSGASTVTDSSGDEDESDLDVEWSGAIAKSATVNFVYVGNNQNDNVFDALQYAVDNKLAPIISISYGACEADNSQSAESALQTALEQANSQGQTVLGAGGDDGAADCDYSSNGSGGGSTIVNGDQATQGLAVDFPGSSPNVTAVGGSEFDEGSSDYWNGSNNGDGGSATGYIPEKVWNDTSPSIGIAAGGGGKSILFGKPSWQTGNGVPADGARDVPDIALNASPDHDGYIVCASGDDSSSCSNGFANSSGDLDIFGGTSFGPPTFSGILTLINQQLGSGGQGNLNPAIYALAASSPGAFHDITVGNNIVPCESGSPDCGSSGSYGYSAAPGYDLASGWGSVDAYNLAQAFASQSTGALTGTTTSLTDSTETPVVNTAVTFTAAVEADSGTSTPTGTVQFAVDGVNAGGPASLSSGVATYAATFSTVGTHTVTASYSGDSTHSASSATLTVTVAGTGSFALSATNVSIASGGSGSSTITVTPSGGYTGTIAFTATLPSALSSACYTSKNAQVTGTGAVTTTLTIDTAAQDCTTAGGRRLGTQSLSGRNRASAGGAGHNRRLGGATVALASLFLLGFSRRRRARWQAMVGMFLLAALTFGVGCGGGGSSATSTTTTPTPTSTSYTITVTGTDSTNDISASTTFTLTIQ